MDNIRKKQIKTLCLEMGPYSSGIFIVGSTAYGTEKTSSDMDVAVISDRLAEIVRNSSLLRRTDRNLRREEYWQARERFNSAAQSFKEEIDGRLISVSIYPPPVIDSVFHLSSGEINYVRNTPNNVAISLFNLFRRRYESVINNIPLEQGLILAPEPIIIRAETTYVGPIVDAILKKPLIVQDHQEIVKSGLECLWSRIYQTIIEEAETKLGTFLKTGRLPIIARDNLPQSVREHIKQQLKKASER